MNDATNIARDRLAWLANMTPMTNLYQDRDVKPKWNAQHNLAGRTHYVDDETLRWHKSRVLSARAIANGLLFTIVTSDALDMHNTKRGFRYVIFDLFGTVVSRVDLEHAFTSSERATKAMWTALNEIDAVELTLKAIDNAERHFASDMAELRARITRKQEAA